MYQVMKGKKLILETNDYALAVATMERVKNSCIKYGKLALEAINDDLRETGEIDFAINQREPVSTYVRLFKNSQAIPARVFLDSMRGLYFELQTSDFIQFRILKRNTLLIERKSIYSKSEVA